MLVIFSLVGVGVGWFIGRAARAIEIGFSLNISNLNLPVLILGAVVLLALTLAAHEAGHLLGGRLVGFRFILFIVGPLKIVREGNEVRVRLNKDVSLYGGLASAIPTDDKDLPRRMAVMIAGGPLTSLLMGGLSLGLGVWLNAHLPSSSPWSVLTAFAFIFGLLNLVIFIVTLIPGKTSGFDTDGAQLIDVLRGGHRAERRGLVTALSAVSTHGVRPRAWNAEQVERLLALREGRPDDVLANFLGYYHFLDLGQTRQAGELLDLCLKDANGFPEAARPMIFAEAAYFTAHHRQEATAARQFLASAFGGLVESYTRLRAEAAVLLAEGRFAEAADRARAGLAQVSKSWDKGGAASETEWLTDILTQAEILNGANPQ